MFLYTDAATQIDSRLALSTNLRRFNPLDHSGPTYTPNASFWLSDVNLTASSPWNSGAGSKAACQIVGRRHAIGCHHFPPGSAGGTVRAIKSDGTVVTNTIAGYAYITNDDVVHTGSAPGGTRKTDIVVVEFTGDWDLDIEPYAIPSSDILNFLPSDFATAHRVPVIATNRSDTNSLDNNAGVSDLATIAAVDSASPVVNCLEPIDANRLSAYSAYVGGAEQDSGGAIILLTTYGPLYILSTRTAGAGSSESAMISPTDLGRMYTALSATGDAPTVFTLSNFYSAVPKSFNLSKVDTTVTLTWTIGSGIQTSVKVYYTQDSSFTTYSTATLAPDAEIWEHTPTVGGTWYYRVVSVDPDDGDSVVESTKSTYIVLPLAGEAGVFYLRPVTTLVSPTATFVPSLSSAAKILGRAYQNPNDMDTPDSLEEYQYDQYIDVNAGDTSLKVQLSTEAVPNDVMLLGATLEVSYTGDNTFGATPMILSYKLYDASSNVLVAKTVLTTMEIDTSQQTYTGTNCWLLVDLGTQFTLTQLKGAILELFVDGQDYVSLSMIQLYTAAIKCSIRYPNLAGPYTVKYDGPGTSSWVAPDNIDTTRAITCIALAGGGGSGSTSVGEGGGAGGGCSIADIKASVTPGSSYSLYVGRGGLRNNSGYDSNFTTLVVAKKGSAGVTSTGGTNPDSGYVGDSHYVGGAGGNGASGTAGGGGGGGAASHTAAGTAGTNQSAGTGGTGGASGGTGYGAGGNGGNTGVAGQSGSSPGGGGGGGGNGTGINGGHGQVGFLKLTYYLIPLKSNPMIMSSKARVG